MEESVTVTQLNTRVKSILGKSPEVNDVWVTGEISNYKLYSSGHAYFTLKDSGSEIRCTLFRSARSRMNFEPGDNMEVTAFGNIDIYVERGSYQFNVLTMKKGGVGNLYAEFEKLKKKLEAEGLFETARKRSLPAYPKTVGVVTSPTGAVIHDIVTTAGRRFPTNILLAPAQVQGEGASASIAAGIRLLNKMKVDVIIVGRGGGSMEDLWAFNEERTVRAIADSEVPIISAVGHETDFTLSDFAADVRAATPTAAAELALRDRKEVLRQIEADNLRLKRSLSDILEKMHGRFRVAESKLSPKRAEEMVAMKSLRLDRLSGRLASSLGNTLDSMQRRLLRSESRLEGIPERIITKNGTRIENISGRLNSLSPYNVLKRGYGMVTDGDGKALTSAEGLKTGDGITVRFRDGLIEAEIKEVKEL